MPFTPYQGYLHLIPRLAAGLVSLLPVSVWALSVRGVSCLLVGCVAGGVWLCARALGFSRMVSAVMAMIPVLEPMTAVEALGNLANFHWYVLYLLAWIAAAGRRLTIPWAWAGVILVCCLSEIQGVLLVPVVIVTWWRLRVAWPIVGAWVVGLGAQVMAFLLGRARDRGEGHLSLARLGAGYVGNVVLGGLGETGEPRPPMYAAMRLLVAAVLFLVVLVLGFIALRRSPHRWLALCMLALSVASWMLAVLQNNSIKFGWQMYLLRWGTTASMALLTAWVLALLEARAPDWVKIGVAAIALAMILRGFPATALPRGATTPGFSLALEAARQTCSTSSEASVPIWPDSWIIRIPCARVR